MLMELSEFLLNRVKTDTVLEETFLANERVSNPFLVRIFIIKYSKIFPPGLLRLNFKLKTKLNKLNYY